MARREAEKQARVYARQSVPELARTIDQCDRVHAWASTVDPRQAAATTVAQPGDGSGDEEWSPERMALWLADCRLPAEREKAERAQLAFAKKISMNVSPLAEEFSLDGLLA